MIAVDSSVVIAALASWHEAHNSACAAITEAEVQRALRTYRAMGVGVRFIEA